MCDSIMTNYKLIGERGGRHEDIVLDLFDALLSGKNDVLTVSWSAVEMTGRLVRTSRMIP